jgi:hypothetical protein
LLLALQGAEVRHQGIKQVMCQHAADAAGGAAGQVPSGAGGVALSSCGWAPQQANAPPTWLPA